MSTNHLHPSDQKRLDLAVAAIRDAMNGPRPLFWFNPIVNAYGERIAHLARIIATTPA